MRFFRKISENREIKMLFTGLGRSAFEETVPEFLSTAQGLYGPMPRAVPSIRTSRPGNNTYIFFQKCGNKFHIFKRFTRHQAEGRAMDRIVTNFMRKTTEVSTAPLNTMFSSVMSSFEILTGLLYL